MKITTLAAVAVSAFIAFTQALAQNANDKKAVPESGGAGHSHFTTIPATVEEIWKEIQKQQAKLVKTVEEKDLGEAHDHAFAIRDLVKALPAKIPAADKAMAEESSKAIAKLAAEIDKSAAAGAQKATEMNVKKMGEAVLALQAKLNQARKKP